MTLFFFIYLTHLYLCYSPSFRLSIAVSLCLSLFHSLTYLFLGDVSNLSTPDATIRKPVGGKISAVNTLKNQLGTLRTNLGVGNNNNNTLHNPQQNTLHVVNLENSPVMLSIDQGGTLRNGGLSDSGRATLRKQISGNVGNNLNNNANIFIDENSVTMKNELDVNSRATLRQQLNADEQQQLQQQQRNNNGNYNLNGNLSSNIDTNSRFRSSSTASYLVPQAQGVGGGGGYSNPNNHQYNNQIPPRPSVTSSNNNNNHNTLNNNRSGAEVSTLRFQADSANVATLRRGLKLDYTNEGKNNCNNTDTDEDQVLTPKTNVRSVHAGSIDLNSNGNNNGKESLSSAYESNFLTTRNGCCCNCNDCCCCCCCC